jgi:hypothetical protein
MKKLNEVKHHVGHPTSQLRLLKTETFKGSWLSPKQYEYVLQQKWEDTFGNEEWEEIKIVYEDDL